jgi:acyl carrier protein
VAADSKQIVRWVREFVAQHSGKSLDALPEYTPDRDLFENGDLDSFGFVELLSVLGDRTGHTLDLSDVDPAELAVLGNLVARFSRGAPR